MVSPWSGSGASVTTFAVSTAIWLIIVQWLSSGVGGYLAGRLRTKWVGIHTDEVYFRDTAHGFLAWALATLLVVGVLGSALSAALGSGVQAVSTVASGAAMGASAGASANAGGASTDNATSYLVDSLFRPADASKLAAANPDSDAAAVGQASRILIASAAAGEISADDKTYLSQLVAARTGLSEADAKARVDALVAKVEDAKVKAQAGRRHRQEGQRDLCPAWRLVAGHRRLHRQCRGRPRRQAARRRGSGFPDQPLTSPSATGSPAKQAAWKRLEAPVRPGPLSVFGPQRR